MATAIENTEGDVRSQTELLVRHMVQSQPGGKFTLTSFPTSADVDIAIVAAHAEILSWFASFDYDVVLANWSVLAKDTVSWYNALGAAYRLENAHVGAVFTAQAKSRADGYHRQYIELKKSLVDGMSFVEIGIPRLTSRKLQGSVTGVDEQEKRDSRTETDRTQPFFEREQFRDQRARVRQQDLLNS